ncbi:MAG: glycosyltransferase family 4 protein [Candidatus Marinimicrobia bacterium]|nr:glycosyltransferase family 4 protein [Candidatus Neomarinimicrobiota bacterium]
MKILIITQYYPPEIGAAATRWSEYAGIMTSRGHQVTVLSELPNYPSGTIAAGYPKFKYFTEESTDPLLRVIRTPVWANPRKTTLQRLGFFISFMISATLRALLLPQYDLIIVSSPPLFVGLIATFLRPFKKAKYVLDLRDIWPESAQVLGEIKSERMLSFGRFLERMVYRSVDAFFLAVPGFRKYLAGRHPAQAAKLKLNLMNGVSKTFIDLVSNRTTSNNKKFTVLFSGNIGLAQGLETVLEAAKSLLPTDIIIKIIGDGAKRDALMLQAESMRLSNVTFISSMSRELLADQILSADICLVPLIKSPLFLNAIPSKMLEYMAAGKPVIVGIKGEVEKLLSDSGAGVSIDPENSSHLTEMILEYKNSPERVKAEGLSGSEYIQAKMTKEVMLEQAMVGLFEDK